MRNILIIAAASIPFVLWRDWLLYLAVITLGMTALFRAAADTGSMLHRTTRWMLSALGVLLTVYLWSMVVLVAVALLVGFGVHPTAALILIAAPTALAAINARALSHASRAAETPDPSAIRQDSAPRAGHWS